MASHLEFLVEEPSMEAFLRALLPRALPGTSYDVHAFQGKDDLLAKLTARLKGYAQWLPEDWRIVVVVDRDDDDCLALKRQLEAVAQQARLRTPSRARRLPWRVLNRIAIEELEAWYFGDWEAVRAAYPRVSATIPHKQPYRDPDAIRGGTWERFEDILQKAGYFKAGLPKIEVARTLGGLMVTQRNDSRSFVCLVRALAEAMA